MPQAYALQMTPDVADMRAETWMNFAIHDLNRRIAESIEYTGCVVDLGCGSAPYKQHILKTASEYIGVDWQHSLHDQSQVDIFADLIRPLPIEEEYADMVVSFQVMEHLKEPESFLREAFRILRRGGALVITVPFMWHVHEAPHDYGRYTRFGLSYLLEKAGFVELKIQENTGFWFMIALKFNYHTARYKLGPFKMLLIPIWWLGQKLGPLLDRIDWHPEETVSYTVRAKKPSQHPDNTPRLFLSR
jgi:SAM-dependent methyltransferase